MELAKLADEIEEKALLVIMMNRLGVDRIEVTRDEIMSLKSGYVKRSEDVVTGAIVFTKMQ